MHYFGNNFMWAGTFIPLFALLAIWSIAWKGMALWKSARQGEKVWFVVLLIVNTAGILEILYLYVFSKKSAATKTSLDSHETPVA